MAAIASWPVLPAVCADTLGVSDAFVRAGFVTLSMVWGLGVLVYLALWLMALDRVEDTQPEPVATHQAVGLGLAFGGSDALPGSAGVVALERPGPHCRGPLLRHRRP